MSSLNPSRERPRSSRLRGARLALAVSLPALAIASCAAEPPRIAEPATADTPPAATLSSVNDDAGVASAQVTSDAAGAPKEPAGPCPTGMSHVKTDFCTDMERFCVKNEYDKANRISICHRFKEGSQKCIGKRVPLDFCIDHYEFPNRAGAKPPVMVDWYDAMGQCAALGKRLCYESEWVAACEGPDETPFPYGWARSSEKCNIDNTWINPSLKKVYSKDPAVSQAELDRLWQGVPSGSKPGCVSGYGVYDLTGNVDEWAMADRDRPEERAVFAALKGGAWGHVRNACRPVTTSHEPEFRYYFVSFRCCKDAAPRSK